MKWGTRPGLHVDRLACAWLIRRFIDPEAEFLFVDDVESLPSDVIAFDMRGVDLSHHGSNCTFETMLERYALSDTALADVGRIVHEADIADELYDAPEAPGLDVLIRGLSMIRTDEELLQLGAAIFDALYEFRSRANLLGRDPS